MDKNISIQVNCNRKISGVLRGFDAFMNLVVDEAFEDTKTSKIPMGTVVNFFFLETLILFFRY